MDVVLSTLLIVGLTQHILHKKRKHVKFGSYLILEILWNAMVRLGEHFHARSKFRSLLVYNQSQLVAAIKFSSSSFQLSQFASSKCFGVPKEWPLEKHEWFCMCIYPVWGDWSWTNFRALGSGRGEPKNKIRDIPNFTEPCQNLPLLDSDDLH